MKYGAAFAIGTATGTAPVHAALYASTLQLDVPLAVGERLAGIEKAGGSP
jgi:hypothetical protein